MATSGIVPGAAVSMLPPPPDLAAAVEYTWQLVLPAVTTERAAWRVVVDGYIDVALRLPLTPEVLRTLHRGSAGGSRLAVPLDAGHAVVCGAATTARLLPMTVPLLVTGARFRLGAAAEVLRCAPGELVNGARSLHELLDGAAARDVARALASDGMLVEPAPPTGAAGWQNATLVDPLAAAVARECVHAIVRRLLRRRASRPSGAVGPDPRVRHALALMDHTGALALDRDAHRAGVRPGSEDASEAFVTALAGRLGTSRRTLERDFATHIGFAPRLYRRLRRVGAVAQSLERAAPWSGIATTSRTLSDLAHTLGYADHAHMTREFTGMMGVSPSGYRREVLATPVARRVEDVHLERTVPLGTVTTATAPTGAPPPVVPSAPVWRASGMHRVLAWPLMEPAV